jgi:acyl-coenzyme A synthetase/AMP-(fatty) acid ligase
LTLSIWGLPKLTKLDATAPAVLWIEGRPVALDENGPADVIYDAAGAADFETIGGFEVIERAAHNNPNKVAIDDGTIRLTYAEFLDRVYGLAEQLIAKTTQNSVVASVVPNTAASPVVIMACALSGRVLVPMDAGHPLERNQAIFAESGAELVLLASDDIEDLTFIPSTIKRIMVDPLIVTNSNRPQHGYDCDAPLFVSFTSGSTGRPKGLVSGGRYGGSALHHFIDMFHLNPSDVILGLASLSSGGARDAFAALGVGATIRLFDMRAEGFAGVLRVLDQDKISILSFVPSALRAILGVPGAEEAFQHLRVLDLHGERILASDIALFRSKLSPTCHISITMGSLEAGAVFSWFVRDDKIEGTVAPVGYLMPDRRVALVNEGGQPVAVGETGELFVRGSMAMGAWRGGHMETGPFIEDSEDSGSSIYSMGDLVRQRSDGLFEYVGRSDRKLKVRGLWADLGEVEAALRAIDGIEDVAVISASDNLGQEMISAFVVMKEGFTPPALNTIRQLVAKETADQMAPTGLYVLDSIPRLANFKPDNVRLKAMTQHDS